MKLTKNQMEILLNILNTLNTETSNKVYDYKAASNSIDFHDEILKSIKELRVIKSVIRKLSEEIRLINKDLK
jgi:hypothetical protein